MELGWESGMRWDGAEPRVGVRWDAFGMGSGWDRDAVGWGRAGAGVPPGRRCGAHCSWSRSRYSQCSWLFPSHLAGQEGEAAVGAKQRPRDGAAAVPAALPGARRLLKHPLPCGDRHWVRGSERPEPPQDPRPPAPALPGSSGKIGRRPPGAPLMAQGLWPGGPGAPGPERPGREPRAPGPARAARPPLRHPALPWHPCPGIPPLGARDSTHPDPSDPGIPPLGVRHSAPRHPSARYWQWERGGSPGAGAPQADGGAAPGTPEVQRWGGGTDPGTPSGTGGSGVSTASAPRKRCPVQGNPQTPSAASREGGPGASPGRTAGEAAR